MSRRLSPRNSVVQHEQPPLKAEQTPVSTAPAPALTPAPKLLLTLAEAAACLSVSRAHLYRLLKSGELCAVHSRRATRVAYAELERYVAALINEGR